MSSPGKLGRGKSSDSAQRRTIIPFESQAFIRDAQSELSDPKKIFAHVQLAKSEKVSSAGCFRRFENCFVRRYPTKESSETLPKINLRCELIAFHALERLAI